MAGRPQRGEAKVAVQFDVDETALARVLPLIEGESRLNMSLSRLIEAILLLAKNEYTLNASRDFVGELCLMKEHQIKEGIALRGKRLRRKLHLTIDREALEFVDMLVMRYRPVVHARGTALTLILWRFSERLTSTEKIAWMKRRLEEMLIKYPVRY